MVIQNNGGPDPSILADEFAEALSMGDGPKVAQLLRLMGTLEGESLEILAGLIEGDSSLRPTFPYKLSFAGWGRGSHRTVSDSARRKPAMPSRSRSWSTER